jgi:hypothetical protein
MYKKVRDYSKYRRRFVGLLHKYTKFLTMALPAIPRPNRADSHTSAVAAAQTDQMPLGRLVHDALSFLS